MVDLRKLHNLLVKTQGSLEQLSNAEPTPENLQEMERVTGISERLGAIAEKAATAIQAQEPKTVTTPPPMAPPSGLPLGGQEQAPIPSPAAQPRHTPVGPPGAGQVELPIQATLPEPGKPSIPRTLSQQYEDQRNVVAETSRAALKGLSGLVDPEVLANTSLQDVGKIQSLLFEAKTAARAPIFGRGDAGVRGDPEELGKLSLALFTDKRQLDKIGEALEATKLPQGPTFEQAGITTKPPSEDLDAAREKALAKYKDDILGLFKELRARSDEPEIPDPEKAFVQRLELLGLKEPRLFSIENLIFAIFFGAPTVFQNFMAEKRAFQAAKIGVARDIQTEQAGLRAGAARQERIGAQATEARRKFRTMRKEAGIGREDARLRAELNAVNSDLYRLEQRTDIPPAEKNTRRAQLEGHRNTLLTTLRKQPSTALEKADREGEDELNAILDELYRSNLAR